MNTIHKFKVIIRKFSLRREKLCAIHLAAMWYTGKPLKATRYGNTGKNITDRDRQAMYNFYMQGISPKTIAENYECSIAYVLQMINTRPWLHPAPNEDAVNMTWMESDHSDPFELVKIFYPDKSVSPKIIVKERCYQEEITWREYYDSIDWVEVRKYGWKAEQAVYERTEELAAREGIKLTFLEEKKKKFARK